MRDFAIILIIGIFLLPKAKWIRWRRGTEKKERARGQKCWCLGSQALPLSDCSHSLISPIWDISVAFCFYLHPICARISRPVAVVFFFKCFWFSILFSDLPFVYCCLDVNMCVCFFIFFLHLLLFTKIYINGHECNSYVFFSLFFLFYFFLFCCCVWEHVCILTFFPSNSWVPCANTLSTLDGSPNVINPKPLQINKAKRK